LYVENLINRLIGVHYGFILGQNYSIMENKQYAMKHGENLLHVCSLFKTFSLYSNMNSGNKITDKIAKNYKNT